MEPPHFPTLLGGVRPTQSSRASVCVRLVPISAVYLTAALAHGTVDEAAVSPSRYFPAALISGCRQKTLCFGGSVTLMQHAAQVLGRAAETARGCVCQLRTVSTCEPLLVPPSSESSGHDSKVRGRADDRGHPCSCVLAAMLPRRASAVLCRLCPQSHQTGPPWTSL